eukprot:9134117-Heterocapsa_arctica.AAC.1
MGGRDVMDIEKCIRLDFQAVRNDLGHEAIAALKDRGQAQMFISYLLSGKVHVSTIRRLDAAPREWETLCGWQFGLLNSQAAGRSSASPASHKVASAKC